jgi:hypothetical protein
MKTSRFYVVGLLAAAWGAGAATTINAPNAGAWGANVGWANWRGDVANGAVIGEYVCSGFVWFANCGWMNLGDGTPANGIQYQNNVANDCGVNVDALGNLRGFAWHQNLGWANFHALGSPKVDLKTGDFSGYVWLANAGWVSLNNVFAHVQTDVIRPGADSDGDGIADAWELVKFGNLATATATSDADGDGFTDRSEYLADTNPLDSTSYLHITAFTTSPGGSPASATWTSTETRCYRLWKTTEVSPTLWTDVLGLIIPDAGTSTTRAFADAASPHRFFRVEAVRPLFP